MRHSLWCAVLALPLLANSQDAGTTKHPAPAAKKAGPVTKTKQTTSKAGKAEPADAKLPTKEEVEVALQRSLGYDASQTWEILWIGPSGVSGISTAVVRLNKKDVESFYILPSVQKAIRGEMIPFGPNPFADARAKLLAADGPARGAGKPVITVVEFSDLECPFCKGAQPTVDKLANDFPQVKFIFQQFPMPPQMHPWAMKGAQYADCAAQADTAAFWKFVDAVFENQGGIALATADEKLKELAAASGLDAGKIAACVAAPATQARIEKSMALGKKLNVTGTPTVFINGRELPGLGGMDYEQLKALMQFEIEHAGK
jgi:protein-disulfide isomerase